MNKKRILFPAIGVLILSGAAAATGTVAWFTSTLNAKTATNSITVVKSGSNMDSLVTIYKDFGTDFDEDGTTVKHSQFIDGSVDLATGTVYRADFNKAGTTCTGFTAVANGKDSRTATQYRATKFDVTLTMKMKDEVEGTTYGLFVDADALLPEKAETTNDSDPALRVGFKCDNEYLVWAPYDETATALKYVNDTATNGHTDANAYTAEYAAAVKLTTSEKTVSEYNKDSKLYLGDFVRPADGSGKDEFYSEKLTVSVYTWFEGSALVNGSTLNTSAVTYTVAFNAVKNLA